MNTTSKEIVLATGNRGKVAELQGMLNSHGVTQHWQVRPQSDWDFTEAEETGLAFVENAIIKARHACQHTGLAAIADDSGISVDALDGAPGVYSARFAGADSSDQQNIQRLLTELQDVPAAQRQATFNCVLVYLRHAADPTPLICHGQWHGEILTEAKGDGGFGYDPIFWVEQHQCTAAELSKQQKQAISHRGKALSQLLEQLSQASL